MKGQNSAAIRLFLCHTHCIRKGLPVVEFEDKPMYHCSSNNLLNEGCGNTSSHGSGSFIHICEDCGREIPGGEVVIPSDPWRCFLCREIMR